ncbi:Dedicator of cytokinesis protein 10 [Parelaphostrongylus tenuis]|uniref:Dedicator of cytokinesis protein 10 n=1 Tax=Parelaphostrongylus tenuis TaxID=148309 RepID=A0AAD5N8S2_PARTN|nr:Dedicator of cytokinesis protein 10 [Parelaphostrongylus tenuis]
MYERTNNFKSLVGIYAELQQAYSRAAEVKASGKRHLGTYFRIRFIGENLLKQDHGTDWIYRESGLASLAEVSIQFREYCRQLIGHDRIQVEPEPEEITSVDPSIAYIFVTHVEPVLPEGRTFKHFLAHTNISEFTYENSVFEEHFTDAERQNSLTNQALKRILVKVDGSFPSCRRRLRVISANTTMFSPLEFACQKLEMKANQINAVLNDVNEIRPLDVKGLQLLLQGAVMPTVNAGPLSYAEAFTQPEQKKRYGDDGMLNLELAFRYWLDYYHFKMCVISSSKHREILCKLSTLMDAVVRNAYVRKQGYKQGAGSMLSPSLSCNQSAENAPKSATSKTYTFERKIISTKYDTRQTNP